MEFYHFYYTKNPKWVCILCHITEPIVHRTGNSIYIAYVIKRLIGCIFGVFRIQSLSDCQFKMFIFRICNALIVMQAFYCFQFSMHISATAELLPLFTFTFKTQIKIRAQIVFLMSIDLSHIRAASSFFFSFYIFFIIFFFFCSFVTTFLFLELIEILNLHYLRAQNKWTKPCEEEFLCESSVACNLNLNSNSNSHFDFVDDVFFFFIVFWILFQCSGGRLPSNRFQF